MKESSKGKYSKSKTKQRPVSGKNKLGSRSSVKQEVIAKQGRRAILQK
jgi:hypothetical protein